MYNFTNRLKTALLFSLLCAFSPYTWAQKAGLEINRTSAVDRTLPLFNVAVDANGRKWAANSKGLFQVKAADFAVAKTIPAGQMNVLNFRGGNSDFSWSEAAFRNQVKVETNVTAAWYDEKTGTLWLGTDDAGLLQFKTDPELQLVEKFTPANSKLRSNNITIIFQDKTNRLWVGTDQGVMYGNPGRWKAELRGYDVQRVREYGQVIYALAAGSISKGVGGEKWSDLALDNSKIEGDITDFDVDQNGKMWIVSGFLTRYDLLGDTYETFSGPEYYTSEFGTHIAVDLEDAVWVGTSDKGLYHVDKASSMTLNAYVDVPISCSGNGKDAIIVAKITGGTAPYTYTWTGGLSGDNPKNVAPGNYSVTVADSKGKSRSAEVGVADVRLRIKARQKKPVSTPGKADGAAEVDIESNASGTQIRWDNGEMMATATQLNAGAHTVTVTDPKGCSATATVTVSEKTQPLSMSIAEKEKIKCAGEKTGSMLVQVTGGKAPFKYAWSDPALSGDQPTNVGAGEYQLTVTDAAGSNWTAKLSLKQPEPLMATNSISEPASTGNADGKATVQAKGGTGAYTYQWDNGETAASALKLAPGQHRVTVTDANGCAAIAAVTITENIMPLSVSLSEQSKINCAGDKTASLAVQVKGGKAPFRYTWNAPGLSGDQASGLAAGDYQLTVTDAAGSTSLAAVNIKQPEPLSASAVATGPAATGNTDGRALAEAKGGAGKYSYKWDNGENTAEAVKLPPGTHRVSITDANGCAATATVTITENILPLAVSIQEKNKVNCAGQKTGALAVQVTGGKGPFRYAWSSPALSGDQPANIQAGDYQLTVTDAAGTTSTASASLTQPEPLSANATVTASASAGNADGKAIVDAKGGAGKFTYQWDNGENTAEAAKLPPGQRSVTVTDANGCTATAGVAITENILPLLINLSETGRIKCAGEKTGLLVRVSGGKPPYRFSWSNPVLNGEQPANLEAGDYAVTVTDAQGTSQTANVSLPAPEPLSAELIRNIGATTERSNDGKAVLSVKGGTGKYSVVWDTKQTGLSAAKLALGKHAVTVTDANGCTQSIDFATEKRVLPELTGKLENGQTIRMRLLNFSTDSSSLKPESLPMLDELYDFMMENGAAVIEIGGHTNNLPSDAFADQLSTARAKSVADYLFAKGIDPKRVVYKGYGKRLPLVPNTSPEGRKTNQRVEIKIVRISG